MNILNEREILVKKCCVNNTSTVMKNILFVNITYIWSLLRCSTERNPYFLNVCANDKKNQLIAWLSSLVESSRSLQMMMMITRKKYWGKTGKFNGCRYLNMKLVMNVDLSNCLFASQRGHIHEGIFCWVLSTEKYKELLSHDEYMEAKDDWSNTYWK